LLNAAMNCGVTASIARSASMFTTGTKSSRVNRARA
jgi:hypothetical protein